MLRYLFFCLLFSTSLAFAQPAPSTSSGSGSAEQRLDAASSQTTENAPAALDEVAAAGDDSMARLYSGDEIVLNVLQWLPAEANYRRLDALRGPYSVGSDQAIDIPFIGRVSVAEKSFEAIASELSDRLYREMAMSARPDVSMGIAKRANVYVLGGVESPGPVPFSGDLTALMAISTAGGYYRDAGGSMRLERDAISAKGALNLARYKAARSIAQLERLEAEIAEEDAITVDSERWSVEVPQLMIDEEERLMTVRRESRQLRLESIENIKTVANQQLETLQQKADNLQEQIGLGENQLGGVQSLVDRGLSTANRSFDLERIVSDLQGRLIDVEQAVLDARLQISQAERDAVDVRTNFRSDVSTALQATRSELNENLNSIEIAEALLREAQVIAPQQMIDRAGRLKVDVNLMLTRQRNGVSQTFRIEPNETLRPGDVLQVQLQPDGDAAPLDLSLSEAGKAQSLETVAANP